MLLFRYLRYAAVGMWAAGLAPLLFVRLGLASPDPAFTADLPRAAGLPQ